MQPCLAVACRSGNYNKTVVTSGRLKAVVTLGLAEGSGRLAGEVTLVTLVTLGYFGQW